MGKARLGKAGKAKISNKDNHKMDIREAVKKVVEAAHTSRSQPSRVIEQLWGNEVVLDAQSQERLAKEGLLARVSNALTNGHDGSRRPLVNDDLPPTTFRPTIRLTPASEVDLPPIRAVVNILYATRYSVGKGESKALIQFTSKDCDYLINRDDAVISGVQRRRDAIEELKALLKKHQVKTLEQTSAKVQEAFARKWKNVAKNPDFKRAAAVVAAD